jgi:hypothetical protein
VPILRSAFGVTPALAHKWAASRLIKRNPAKHIDRKAPAGQEKDKKKSRRETATAPF